MEDILCEPVELTTSELDEVAGGFNMGIRHHVVQINRSVNIIHGNIRFDLISSGNNNSNGSGNQMTYL